MEDKDLLKVIKKGRQKRLAKNLFLNLFLVLLVIAGIGYGVMKYFNYGIAASDDKISGLPNEQLRYIPTQPGDISSLTYQMSGSFAFNFYGENANLKMTTYVYGKKTREKVLDTQRDNEGKKVNLLGYLTLGIRNTNKDESDDIVDYAMFVSGSSTQGSLNLREYGLGEKDLITAYTMHPGIFSTDVKRALFSKERYTFNYNKEIPILIMGSGGAMKFGQESYEELYKDIPWVMVLTLEFT